MLKAWKQKILKKLWKPFHPWLQKESTKKDLGLQGDRICWSIQKFCASEWIQVYSTMSETKAAFAERTIRSLKNNLYRCMEDYGYKYIHKLPQIITTLKSEKTVW